MDYSGRPGNTLFRLGNMGESAEVIFHPPRRQTSRSSFFIGYCETSCMKCSAPGDRSFSRLISENCPLVSSQPYKITVQEFLINKPRASNSLWNFSAVVNRSARIPRACAAITCASVSSTKTASGAATPNRSRAR